MEAENCKTTPRPKNWREIFKSWYFWKPFLALLIGGAAGYLFYYFIGCTSGTCSITSNPYSSIISGSILGFFITNSPCVSCKVKQ